MSKKESIKKNKKYYYNILPAYNISETLVYYLDKQLQVGTIVLVSLRKKDILGCVIKEIINPPSYSFDVKKIKYTFLNQVIDAKLIEFINWFAGYNLVSLGSSLKLFLPNERVIKQNLEVFLKNTNNKVTQKLSTKQKKLILLLNKGKKTYAQLRDHKFTKPSINFFLKTNLVKEEKVRMTINHNCQMKEDSLITLNKEQDIALSKIFKSINSNKVKPILFDGVMGSGKTEVCFKIIESYIRKKKQVLILLPEIALSTQWIMRFEKVFHFQPLIWNSEVSLTKKNLIWQSALNNDPIVVVGARSSLFLPFKNLGIIIVDEESDASYKQEDLIIYNARDMAIVRASICLNSILLVSATPSLESYKNAKEKKYKHVKLTKRFASSKPPLINIIDMKKESAKIISMNAINEIKNNIKNKKQSLILINRRGYAPIQICIKCGHIIKCKNCSINLVLHKNENCLICHHCGERENIDYNCTKCHKKKSIIGLGFGVEKVYEEVKKIFSKEKIIILSSDTISRSNFLDTLHDIQQNNIKIIIGTQIISKGFDFSNLTKVFLLDFDMWFYNSDIRTGERVFQLSQQVVGRAGRRDVQGEVYIQTYDTENKLLRKILQSNRDSFYEEELKARNHSLLPPFVKIAAVIISGTELKDTELVSNNIAFYLQKKASLVTLGPIPAPIFFLRRKYRYRLIIKAKKPFLIQKSLIDMVEHFKNNKKTKFKIDIDPYSFF